MKREKKLARNHRKNEKFAKKIGLEVLLELDECKTNLHLTFKRKGVIFDKEITWQKLLKKSLLPLDYASKEETKTHKANIAKSLRKFIKKLEKKA